MVRMWFLVVFFGWSSLFAQQSYPPQVVEDHQAVLMGLILGQCDPDEPEMTVLFHELDEEDHFTIAELEANGFTVVQVGACQYQVSFGGNVRELFHEPPEPSTDDWAFEHLSMGRCVPGETVDDARFADGDWSYTAEELALRGFGVQRLQPCEYLISYDGYSRILVVITDGTRVTWRFPDGRH